MLFPQRAGVFLTPPRATRKNPADLTCVLSGYYATSAAPPPNSDHKAHLVQKLVRACILTHSGTSSTCCIRTTSARHCRAVRLAVVRLRRARCWSRRRWPVCCCHYRWASHFASTESCQFDRYAKRPSLFTSITIPSASNIATLDYTYNLQYIILIT